MKLALNTIHEIDCIDGFKRLDEPISVIVTSPPYNIDKPYNGYHDKLPDNDYLDWMERVAEAAKGAMADDGSFFLNVGGKPSNQWIPLDVAQRFRKHFVLQNTIIWVKSIAIPKADVGDYPNIRGDLAVGHFKPVKSSVYLNGCFEYVFHFTKSGRVPMDKLAVGVPYQDKTNIKRWKSANGDDLRDRGNTWFMPYETIWEKRPHPTTFPVKLPEMCIRLHGVERAKLVLDPFMGIGTTALACKRLAVPYIGFEIDPSYIRVAEELLAQQRIATEGSHGGNQGDRPRGAEAP